MTYSRRIAYLTWFSFLVSGIFEGVFPAHATASSLIHGLILIVSVFCIFLPIFGLPYYLFRGFGFKSGGLKFLWFFLFLTISIVTYLIPSELIRLLSS